MNRYCRQGGGGDLGADFLVLVLELGGRDGVVGPDGPGEVLEVGVVVTLGMQKLVVLKGVRVVEAVSAMLPPCDGGFGV